MHVWTTVVLIIFSHTHVRIRMVITTNEHAASVAEQQKVPAIAAPAVLGPLSAKVCSQQ